MKVAVLGAPGAGKSDFAWSLRSELGPKWDVLDNYIADIELRGDVALRQHMATYLGNIHVASERILFEAEASSNNLITVGTIVETLVYTTLGALLGQQVNPDAAGQARSLAALELLSIMIRDTWDYDVAFYVPYPPEKAEQDGLDAEVNANILVALKAFDIPYNLVDGSFAVKRAAANIEALHETTTTE